MISDDSHIAPADLVELLDVEICRALVGAFSPETAAFKPKADHYKAFEAAQEARDLSYDADWNTALYEQIAHHWLTLIGHRIRCEDDLLIGGLPAARIRAAESLKLSPHETSSWPILTLLNAYVNTCLRAEWRYNTFQFRERAHIQPFRPNNDILNTVVYGKEGRVAVQ